MAHEVWQDWMDQADHDLEVARGMRENGWHDTSVIQAQQAAEKAAKALWMKEHGRLAPRTHAVDELARQVDAPPNIVAAGERLADVYFVSRYPDGDPGPPFRTVDAAQADARIQDAEEIIAWVKQRLDSN
ncbi:MAG: HEPN domain-containing protein [Armatimonadota bacterium]